MLEEKAQQARDFVVGKAEEANAAADAKADSWVMASAKWLVASRFTWAMLGAGAATVLILLVL